MWKKFGDFFAKICSGPSHHIPWLSEKGLKVLSENCLNAA